MTSKKTKTVAFRISVDQVMKLDRVHQMTDIPKSVLMRKALDALLQKYLQGEQQ